MTAALDLAVLTFGAIAVYYLTTLMIWLGHVLPHRPSSRLRDFHMDGHHAHYPDSRHARNERFVYGKGRNDSLVPQLPWLIALGIALWTLLPGMQAWLAAIELTLIAAAHSYVHMHFHLRHSWLCRFAWFRHAQAAHDIHHDRDVNFMVGDHFWDRRFGTFEQPAGNPQ